ncbi:MAG TPA: thiamine pyrophosphate-dependent enzyme [Candidatus Limnocylindria bacterium]|nr:thiamine pyrophosphate-dependent enzyme [Candidatus Limnocylindria bacterium]
MSWDRVAVTEAALDGLLSSARPAATVLAPGEPLAPGTALTAGRALELFEDQLTSRQVDVAARELKKTDRSFYTIASAGHENNAVLGAQLRITDPVFLHYRSGGFMMARGRQASGATPMLDALLGIVASSDDPIAQGRHKVWGSRPLWVPPQTSTIASHVPKATGLAFALGRARRLGIDGGLPTDSIVACSFGDASVNHATALAGMNTARYGARLGLPMPILFVCEDNDTGISVPTPAGWVADSFHALPDLAYRFVDGEVDEIWEVVAEAIAFVRTERRPLFLHLKTVRLWGHAGSDAEQGYRTLPEIEAVEARDPLLRNARRLLATGAASPDRLRALVRDTRARVRAAAEEATRRPRLETREAVMAPLAPYDREAVLAAAERPVLGVDERRRALGGTLPEEGSGTRTLAASINAALADELARRRELLVFGEDVGRKGGVYGVTAGLQRRFGAARVFDTLLDETSILGMAQGVAHIGLLPVPEIQYLAYLHNALDQIRGEAATLSFFSSGQFRNPMVVRVAGLAYQKGFGGHFHNDNSVGALRDIPGVAIACPARGDDAARMLRGAIAMAAAHGRVVVFLEPIALYHERDLHADGDDGWLTAYPALPDALLPGRVGVYQPDAAAAAPDLLLVSYGNGLRLSLRAQRILARDHGVRARVLDLRWLNPLPLEPVRRHAAAARRVLVVDECRATGGGVADAIVADLAERAFEGRLGSVRAADSFVPLGPAAASVLVGLDDVVRAALTLVDEPGRVGRSRLPAPAEPANR